MNLAEVEDTQSMQMCLDKILGLKPVTSTLNELLSRYGLANHPAKEKFSKVVKSNPDIWKEVRNHSLLTNFQRPFTVEIFEYLVADVLSLLELRKRIYQELHNQVDKLWKKIEIKEVTTPQNNKMSVEFNENWQLVPIQSEENPTPICQVL